MALVLTSRYRLPVLLYLGKPKRPGRVSLALGISPSRFSLAVDELMAAGFVRRTGRKRQPGTRYVRTPKGERFLRRFRRFVA